LPLYFFIKWAYDNGYLDGFAGIPSCRNGKGLIQPGKSYSSKKSIANGIDSGDGMPKLRTEYCEQKNAEIMAFLNTLFSDGYTHDEVTKTLKTGWNIACTISDGKLNITETHMGYMRRDFAAIEKKIRSYLKEMPHL
jgi:hypothetical protein